MFEVSFFSDGVYRVSCLGRGCCFMVKIVVLVMSVFGDCFSNKFGGFRVRSWFRFGSFVMVIMFRVIMLVVCIMALD